VRTVTGTEATDTAVPVGTWHYRVVPVTADGTAGTPSDDVTAVVAGALKTFEITPVADTFANRGAPTTTYGTSSQVSSGGGNAVAYLRYVLPARPAGTVLSSAVFRARTAASTTSGSVDAHQIGTAPDTWDETTLTWNNRPAPGTARYGTLQAGTAANASYDTPLDLPAIDALLGRTTTLTLSSTGTDGVNVVSANSPTPANRPRLMLTFTPDRAPTGPAPKAAFLGDSYSGGSAMDSGPAARWPQLLTTDLAWRYLNVNAGGSGFVVRGPSGTTFGERVPGLVAAAPDIVIVTGGANDASSPRADVAAAAAKVVDDLRAGLPDADIVVLSPFWRSDPGAGVLAMRDDLREIARSRGLRFVDVTAVFAGEYRALIGSDTVHPTDAGQAHIRDVVAPDLPATLGRRPALPPRQT
jgi:lysophospholipase L1-like esterase